MTPVDIKTKAQPRTDDPSWAMRALRLVWNRRRQAARLVHATGHALGWIYDKSPLPRRVKDVTTELTYHAIEHFIVQSEGYQNWLHRHTGLTRLHGLFDREPELPSLPMEAPSDTMWQQLIDQGIRLQATPERQVKVAVIIPVYKGYEETLACIYSVLKAEVAIPFTLSVINDASPDAALAQRLHELQQRGLFDLITQERNQGFVRTVNAGMQRVEDLDVLLLNSDTQVYDGWLDRLYAALQQDERIASVTPFSNNAELCSYPKAFYGGARNLGVSYEQLDQLASQTNAGLVAELPTAVGFCMLMRRAAIEQVGYFDDDTFGRGYGEENDWCLRSADAGWRHVLAADVFVRHAGAVSFAAHKRRELRRSLYKLNQRHPHYRELVRRFRDEDPLRPYRQRLDLARLLTIRKQRAFLALSHNAGGGTEKHIQDLTVRLAAEDVTMYRLSPDPKHASQLRIWHEDIEDCPNLIFDIDREFEALRESLHALGIEHMHIHHMLGFPSRMIPFLERLCGAMNVRYDVSIHDYYFACPSINLVYESGIYEQDPAQEDSERWARKHPTAAGRNPAWLWRQQHNRLLQDARRIYAPSEDTAQRIQRFFPQVCVHVRPHLETVPLTTSQYLPHAPGTPITIALIGRLTYHKGVALIQQMALDAKQRNLPIHFHVFGDTERNNALKRTGTVTLHGVYQDSQIYDLLKAARCHIAFFPSVWPETYSYTLSIALAARIFPVTFDLGAQSERLRQAGWGMILAKELMRDPKQINDALLALETHAPPPTIGAALGQDYASMLRDYYGETNES